MTIWSRLRQGSLGDSFSTLWGLLTQRPRTAEAGEEGGIVFTIGVIALAAKMAAADGAVTHHEVEVFNRLFHVPDSERGNIQRFFNLARRSMAGFESYARDLARLFRDRPGVLEDILDGLFAIALADGHAHPAELDYLARAAEIFGLSEGEFERIRSCHMEPDGCDPYHVLGVARDCSDEELRRTYLRLVRENHPDSLIARGVPEEFIAMANAKLAAINNAYAKVQKLREKREPVPEAR